MEYYIIKVNNKEYETVYDTQDIIRVFCDLINGYGIPESDVSVETITKQFLTFCNGFAFSWFDSGGRFLQYAANKK